MANLRVREGKILLENQCFEGAYYLLGYAVECALKACIAKQYRRFDFPDRRTVIESYSHDLERLLGLSNVQLQHRMEIDSNPQFAGNWGIVRDWSEDKRYTVRISKAEAENLYTAVTARRNGVLTWLKRWW